MDRTRTFWSTAADRARRLTACGDTPERLKILGEIDCNTCLCKVALLLSVDVADACRDEEGRVSLAPLAPPTCPAGPSGAPTADEVLRALSFPTKAPGTVAGPIRHDERARLLLANAFDVPANAHAECREVALMELFIPVREDSMLIASAVSLCLEALDSIGKCQDAG
ncbi:hypothetical protein OG948_60405 (plasmid) [Embleya sp. NBC_00888]|uniref:hypothetical protein n=1 Tax=Embleya sp. NBC_00888 TaxID=2975960 RepID=UPI002F9103A7|nr:hypothetical protein OG948_60405 [Embleya sp. NBC_00888]